MTLEELHQKVAFLTGEIVVTREAIESHPDHIREQLGGIDHPILKRITSIKRVSGWTDSRKNPCEYEGYEFVLDGVKYEARYGSNWCSTTRDVVYLRDDRWECDDLPSWEDYFCGDGDEDSASVIQLLEGREAHVAVALSLLVLGGIVG